MPKFHVSRTVRTYFHHLLDGELDGTFSDRRQEWTLTAKNEREAEAKARAEGDNFRIDEVLSVSVEPFEAWLLKRAMRKVEAA